jgi:hypothetical protein
VPAVHNIASCEPSNHLSGTVICKQAGNSAHHRVRVRQRSVKCEPALCTATLLCQALGQGMFSECSTRHLRQTGQPSLTMPIPVLLLQGHTSDMDAIQHDQDCTLHTAPGLLFVHSGFASKPRLVGDARATVILSPAKLKGKAAAQAQAPWDDSVSVKDTGLQTAAPTVRHPGLTSRRISSHGRLRGCVDMDMTPGWLIMLAQGRVHRHEDRPSQIPCICCTGHEDDKRMPRTEEELNMLRKAGTLPQL